MSNLKLAFAFFIATAFCSTAFSQTDGKTAETLPTPAATPTAAQSNERYRIGFQDTLEVTVFRHPELSQVVSVGTDGTIILPRISKPIVVVCKTERELADTLTNLYKEYLKSPFVNVRAVDQRSQPFAVVGAVEKPGSFFLNRKVQLLELLALAGGPDVELAGSRVQVARIGNIVGCRSAEDETVAKTDDVEFQSFNLNDVLTGKQNPWMQPGDIVSVLVAEEAYIVGNVEKPTKISLREPVTATQAIAQAGGLKNNTGKSNIKIQRRMPSGAKVELLVDLKAIAEKKAEDPLLLANDIIEVPTDKGKVIRSGIVEALTKGIPNLFYAIPL